MIIHGDRERRVDSAQLFKTLEQLAERAAHEEGSARKEAWRDLLIETGACAQGILDSVYTRQACDGWGVLERLCHLLCRSAAEGFTSMLGQGSGQVVATATYRDQLSALRALQVPRELTLREPDGYAYDCLYPELYVQAAQAWAEERTARPVYVIGIRSIGCSLGAVVATTLQAARFCTVRPGGHPYARTVAPSAELAQLLLGEHKHVDYAIVDEGPGASGSSFAAVARWLRDHGVRDHQLHYFPSHGGEPGQQCAEPFRDQYAHAARHHRSFDQAIARDRGRAIGGWFEQALGRPLDGPVEELSGGRWRALTYEGESAYPAANVPGEARKYLLRLGGRRWLAKFLGLGESRRQLIHKLRVLGDYGFAPVLRAARHGFALFEWQEGAAPLDHAGIPRARIVPAVARYLTFLARNFPTTRETGARPTALLQMAEHNVRECFGDSPRIAAQLAKYRALLPSLEETHSPVVTDNKLDSHEWLLRADGRIVKCDALEHAHAHDLIGCQDPAWDVAGATVELKLGPDEQTSILRALHDVADVRMSAEKIGFFQLAYLAFRTGYARLAEQALAAWPDDALRMVRVRQGYEQQLGALFV